MRELKYLLLFCCSLMTVLSVKPISAQTLEGTWEGHLLSVKGKIPANTSFKWDKANNWGIPLAAGTWTSFSATLEIQGEYKNLSGIYTATNKNPPKTTTKFEFDGNFNFEKKLMVWQPGKIIAGKSEAAKTVIRSMNYSHEDGDDYEYFKGRWASSDGWNGVMEFRRKYNGTPLKDDNVHPDFFLPETDGTFTIKMDDFYLALNDDKNGIHSKKDAVEEARQWKFEAAPAQFKNAFRIIPVGKEDHCLQATEGDDATVSLATKEDKPEGEQYWRFERDGDGFILVNVKLGGRGMYIENEESGQTILRSRNEAHKNKWKVEKHG